MPYKRTQNGKTTWIGQVQWNGIRKKKTFSTKREAAKWELKLRKQLKSPKQNTTPTDSVLEWANSYLDYAQKYQPKVFSEKKSEFKRFLSHKTVNPDNPITELTPGLVMDYYQGQFKKRGGKVVNNKIRKNLAAAYSYGVKYRNFPMPNPFLVPERFPEDEIRGHYVPPENDFWAVYRVAEGQDRLLLLTFLHTAGRRSEVYRLKWEDVDLDSRQIALKTRKSKDGSLRKDWIPLTDELAQALKLHEENAQSEYVFTQPNNQNVGRPYKDNRGFPQRLCKKAGVKKFGCHGIRGLSATILAQNGVPMKAVQEVLRHGSLSVTERYLRKSGLAGEALRYLEGRSSLQAATPMLAATP